MLQAQTLAQLEATALALPVKADADLEFILSNSSLTRGTRYHASAVTFKHAVKYMEHLSTVLPHALGALGNPAHWQVERLLDTATMTLRRPTVYLKAEIRERGTLYISVGHAPPASLANEGAVAGRARPNDTDFRVLSPIWPFRQGGSDTLVRLTPAEHPARREFGPGDGEVLLKEEECQRDAFLAFLSSMVASLRAVLDVRIIDWVEFNDRARLVEVSFEDRVLRLAAIQRDSAAAAFEGAKRRYSEALLRAGVSEAHFERALTMAEEADLKLREAVYSVSGHSAQVMQLRACTRARQALPAAKAYEEACRSVWEEASRANDM